MKLTIKIRGVEFDVEFDYQPEEAEERHDSNNTGYPGCSAEIGSIYVIDHKGTDFLEFFEKRMDVIEASIWIELKKDEY